MNFLAVFIGGGIGSLCRYGISLLTLRSSANLFPWATLIANVLSCLVMAAALTWFIEKIPQGSWQRAFILIGLCGGFSTFSTFSLENFQLLKDGHTGFLVLNILVSVILCGAIFWLALKRV